MLISKCRNKSDFLNYVTSNKEYFDTLRILESKLNGLQMPGTFDGFSYPAGKVVPLSIDLNYSDGVTVNWRERLVCPITKLNNRIRACVQLLEERLLKSDDKIYISEQCTPLFRFLNEKYDVVGSEYLGEGIEPGTIRSDGIRHEDLSNLSFNDSTYDLILSFDCLEHLPKYQDAFQEIYRVLDEQGLFVFSIPFDFDRYISRQRAYFKGDGELVYVDDPQYHGDPVRPDEGVLVFHDFGWDITETMRSIGFSDVYNLFYSSIENGYLGGDSQHLFVAHK